MNEPKYVLFDRRQSLGESLVSDGATFGFLLLCIWASQGSKWWTFCTALMFLSWLVAKLTMGVRKRQFKFYNFDDMQAWIEKERSNA